MGSFKVGDKVRVKNGISSSVDTKCGQIFCKPYSYEQYIGIDTVIIGKHDDYEDMLYLDVDNRLFVWHESWLKDTKWAHITI